MAELQQITMQIEQAAKEKAGQIMADAKAQYEDIMHTYKVRGEQEKAKIAEKAKKDAERITQMAISAAAQKSAQDILAFKINTIEQVIEQAKQSVVQMEKDVYMQRMEKLLDSKITKPYQKGIIYFNAEDLKSIPKAFKDKIKEYDLEIAKEPIDISGGFLLVFGKIEENCSVDALFRERYEQLVDFVGTHLF